MKLLMENWREYLNEGEGDFFPWLQQLRDDPAKFIEDQQDLGGRVGSGSFRTVVVPESDKDFVVKIMTKSLSADKDFVTKILRYDDSDSYMNKVEKLLGDEYPDIFPRVFAYDPDYRWIVVERVQPISTSNEEMLEEALVATIPRLHDFVYDLLSLEDGSPSMDTKPFAMFRYIVMAAAPRLLPHLVGYGSRSLAKLEKIKKIKEFGLANEPWFMQLSKSMKRYGVNWSDLQEGNVGVDMKTHTLKIIDASVFSDRSGEKDWN